MKIRLKGFGKDIFSGKRESFLRLPPQQYKVLLLFFNKDMSENIDNNILIILNHILIIFFIRQKELTRAEGK